MTTLYFLRHGIAEDAAPGMPDSGRKLTDEGRANMLLEAEALKRLDLKLDEIITSPLARALETAQIVAEVIEAADELHVDDRLACGCSMGDLRRLLADYPNADRLLLVGHNPDFTILPSQLVGQTNLRMPKGAIARVDVQKVEPGAGELRWLIPPKLLVLAGGFGDAGAALEP